MSTEMNQMYRSSLVLNNRGVQLLEMQSYRDAIVAFNNALTFIKGCYNDSSTDPIDEECINKALNDTSSQLTQVKQQQQTSKTQQNSIVVVTEDRSLNTELISIAMATCQTSNMKTCIRIDDMDGHCEIDDSNLMIESAIIVYNLATAYHAFSTQKSKKSKSGKATEVIEHAHTLYNVAMSILSEVDTSEYEDAQYLRLAIFKMIIVQGQLQVAILSGRVEEGRKFYCQLGDLHSEVNGSDVLSYSEELEETQDTLPAAAA
jgi:hypothetical protein